MTAPRSLVLSGIALAAALASMPSHAGWLSNLWGSGGSQTGVSYDDSWSDAAGTATAPATSTTTSPTATPKPTLTARPARTVADSTGTVALTGVEQRWKKPVENSEKNILDKIPAIVRSQGVGKSWVAAFVGEEKCYESYKMWICFKIQDNPDKPFILTQGGRSNYVLTATTPFDYRPILAMAKHGGCNSPGFGFYLEPLGYNAFTGKPPTGWQLRGESLGYGTCADGGG